jgi:hypothetical protein
MFIPNVFVLFASNKIILGNTLTTVNFFIPSSSFRATNFRYFLNIEGRLEGREKDFAEQNGWGGGVDLL